MVLDSLIRAVRANRARLVRSHPGDGREEGQKARHHGAEPDQQHEKGDQDADGVGIGLRTGLGYLPAEIDIDPRRLRRATGGEKCGLGLGGHVGYRHGIGNHGVGDPAVLGHRSRLVGVGDSDNLGQFAEFGQGRLHRLVVGGIGERLRRRHREDHLGLGAAGSRELLVEKVEGLLGLGAGDGDGVAGGLLDVDRHHSHHRDYEHPSGDHIPTAPEAPLS